jgi:hypothetical protein
LHEEATTIWMLLLNDAKHLDATLLLMCLEAIMPHGHVMAASRSPRGKNVKDDFLAKVILQRDGPAILQRRKGLMRKRSALFHSMQDIEGVKKSHTGKPSAQNSFEVFFHEPGMHACMDHVF